MARPGSLFIVAVCSLIPILGHTQVPQDPLLGNYVLGPSAEMIMLRAPFANPVLVNTIFDFLPSPDTVSGLTITDPPVASTFDVATGDVDGDGKEEAAVVWKGAGGSVNLAISRFTSGTVGLAERTTTTLPGAAVQSGIRIVRGNFDGLPRDEFVVGYWTVEGMIRLMIIGVDSVTLKPAILGEIQNVALPGTLGAEAIFDIAVGDFDRDGLSEIFLTKVNAASQWSIPSRVFLTTHLFNVIYDYDPGTHQLSPRSSSAFDVTRDVGSKPYPGSDFKGLDVRIGGLVATAGDYNNDGVDEPAVVWLSGMVFSWSSSQVLGDKSRTYVELLAQPFHVSESLDSLWLRPADIVSCELSVDENSLLESPATAWGPYPASAASADLNGDGADELVTGGFQNVAVYSADALGRFTRTLSTSMPYPPGGQFLGATSHRLLAIADIDPPDSTDRRWTPEIVVASSGIFLGTSGMGCVAYGVTVDTTTLQLKGLYAKTGRTFYTETGIGFNGTMDWAIALGDFNGDGVRLRRPRLIVQQNVLQPLVILNALPIHYDILNDTCYDVCKSFGLNKGEFTSTYQQQSGQTVEFSAQVKSDWGLSTSVTGGGSFLGMGVKSHFTAKYGEGFSKQQKSSTSLKVTEAANTRYDDLLYVSLSDVQFWEYQLFRAGVHRGDVVVVVPKLQYPPTKWVLGKDWEAMWYRPRHEVGNLLSYMPSGGIPAESDVDSLVHLFTPAPASQKSGMNWEITFDQFMSASDEVSRKVGFEAGVSVSGWGWEVGLDGHYNREELSTSTSTFTNGVHITLHVDDIDRSFGETDYTIGPCAYWGQNGALVIDYSVEPERSSGGGLETWWESRYGHLPDPAFNLPWRWDPEKKLGLTNPEKRWLSKSIRLSPSILRAGDQTTITARVYNFSLVPLAVPVAVRLFAGDPDSGGVPIIGNGGVTQLMTVGTIAPRGYQNLQTTWTVPGNLNGITRIYGLIDPDNSLNEIHKENNRGFAELTVLGVTGTSRGNSAGLPGKFELFQNYPNPFNPGTLIQYSLPHASHVTLKVYNLLGQEVRTLVSETKPAGTYTVHFNGIGIASGVYFYRLQAGGYSQTKKFLLVR